MVLFTTRGIKGLLDVVRAGGEIAGKIKRGSVVRGHAEVVHGGAVEQSAALAVRLSVGSVKDVRDAQFPKTITIVGD